MSWKLAGLAHAEVVESGDEPGGDDGEDLRPCDGEGDVEGRAVEPAQSGEDGEDAGEAGGDAGDGGGLGDGEPRPHIEEGEQVAVGAADVDVLAASVGEQRAELGVGHGAEEGEQTTGDPGEVDERGGAGGAHHFLRNEEDAAADDGADDDGGGVRGVQHAGQVGRGRGGPLRVGGVRGQFRDGWQTRDGSTSVVVLEVLPVCLI